MKDRIPRNPGRVLVTPENGAAYYATITRADNPLQEGDALNKLNLLPDEVAEKLGLDPADNPVPADAFEYIAAKALSLRLTVHGGTVEPETASEGNIWVNTSTPISGWAYSLTEPANPTEGKVWLVASAGIALDTLASGNITISPLSARQYIGGVWVTKEAKSFVNGEWKDWLTLLINGADECVDVTGGWESLAVNISGIGTSARALNVTHGADYIQLTGGAGGQGGMYVTKNKITCDGSTSLRISGEIAAYSNRIKIAALSSKGSSGIVAEWIVPGGASAATAKTYTDETVLSLPAGEYYIAFSIYSTDNQYIRLNKVYIAGSVGGTIQPGGGGGEISAELIEQAVKNYLESNPIEETDPTVPEWAKQPEKPEYTAEEVGAQPAGDYATKGEIPTKTSQLNNDSGFITVAVATLLNYYLKSETYKKSETYSATEVDNLVNGLSARLDAFFDTDDATLDQLSEIVEYIKSNKSLIDSITTSKVSVSDIINNLTTSVANKPLSAEQGVVLKAQVDALRESKLDATSLPDAINTALAQAKASGEFDGEPGYTPQKGVDYFTDADQEAIVQQVIAALGTPVFGRVDADNNIILTGELAEGVYTLIYEDTDGSVTEIGTLNHTNAPEVTYTNLFDPATATLNTRMSGSSKAPKTENGYVMTATISLPTTINVGTAYDESTPYMVVPAAMWSGSANMFGTNLAGDYGAYVDAGTTPGTAVGTWKKVPIYNQWGGGNQTIKDIVLSLNIRAGSAITATDIQNIEIYFNEIPE